MPFDFRSYHVRAINASSETEKAAINQELKEVYESLNESDKKTFNEELQVFLMGQYKNLSDTYDQIKNSDPSVN
ncbi:MAG: hypothetical protein ACRCVT_16420 [Leadbetterella sp.]